MDLSLNLVGAVLATGDELPPIRALGYEYGVGANGLFIRAEDSRMRVCLPVALVLASLPGLADVATEITLKTPRIPASFLYSVLASARRHLPNERAFQFVWDAGAWRCLVPEQSATPVSVDFEDAAGAAVDLHSHGALAAFFSGTDNRDEQGLRFYIVIGKVDTDTPEITARVGAYGVTMPVEVTEIFDGLGPFIGAVEDDHGQD